MEKEKPKIKVKISQEKTENWNTLLEILLNENPNIGFYITDGGNVMYVYLENDAGFSLKLTKDGRWELE